MEDVSNRVLAVLLVVSVVTSLSGIIVLLQWDGGPTGFATTSDASGKTNFSIQTALSITFVNGLIPFGSGFVNGSTIACTMGTNQSPPSAASGCVNFNTTVHEANLTINNDGNLRANVSLNFSDNATGFIGGDPTVASFQYRVANVTGEPSCTSIQNGSSFKEVGPIEINGTNARVCTDLNFADAADTIQIGVWLAIPENAPSGEHTVTITAIACDDNSC